MSRVIALFVLSSSFLLILSACAALPPIEIAVDDISIESQTAASVVCFVKMTESAPITFSSISYHCLLYTSPSPRDKRQSRMPSSA